MKKLNSFRGKKDTHHSEYTNEYYEILCDIFVPE